MVADHNQLSSYLWLFFNERLTEKVSLIKTRMFPMGTICGNTYVMKPSERDPSACMALVELLKEAGMPDGVVNIIHGQHDTVNFICDHPDIKAISFVGG